MSNPTDTNQASEDELRKKIKGLSVYKAAVNMHMSYRSDQANLPRFAGSWEKEIESLIRTEKQKLLAEVRERVVGEPIPDNWDDDIDGMIEWKYYTYYRSNAYDFVDGYNMSIAERLEQLTKLEAEL